MIGGRDAGPEMLREAEEAGRLIAQAGCILITGGLSGVMEAASRGAKEAGGLTVGILPADDTESANPYVEIPIATGFGIGRNVIIARSADALVAVGGQYGTLSEIAYALQLGRPVAGIGSWKIEGVHEAPDAASAVSHVLGKIGR